MKATCVLKFDASQARRQACNQRPCHDPGILNVVFDDRATHALPLQGDSLRNGNSASPRKRAGRQHDRVSING
jgi:hypothetical protein